MTKSNAAIITSAIFATVVGVLVSVGTFLFSILGVRFLPGHEVGLFVSFLAYVNIVGMSFAGFQMALMRANVLAQEARRGSALIFHRSTLELLGLGSFAAVLVFLSSPVWNRAVGLNFSLVILVAVLPVVVAMGSALTAHLSARGKFLTGTLVGLLAAVTNLLLQTFGYFLVEPVLSVVLALFVVSSFAVFAVFLVFSRTRAGDASIFNGDGFRAALISAMYALLLQSDIVLAGFVFEGADRTNFVVASAFVKAFVLLGGTLMLALFTILARREADKQQSKVFLSAVGALGLAVALPFVLASFLLGPRAFVLFYGEQWVAAGFLVPYFALASLPYIFVSIVIQKILVLPRWTDAGALLAALLIMMWTSLFMVSSPLELALTFFLCGLGLVFAFAASRGLKMQRLKGLPNLFVQILRELRPWLRR